MKYIYILILLFGFCNHLSAQYNLWGTSKNGGQGDAGYIYKTSSDGTNLTNVYDFNYCSGYNFARRNLCNAGGGKYYGTTQNSGHNPGGHGIIYEYDSTNQQITEKVLFGTLYSGSLMKASNGLLYTISEFGQVVEYNPLTNAFVNKYNFGNVVNNFTGALIEPVNGKLYGISFAGGTANRGTLIEYDFILDTGYVKLSFDSLRRFPLETLLHANNGKLYGTTTIGGSNNKGVLFEYDYLTNTYTKKIDFNGAMNGSTPEGLIQASNGMIYGLTNDGGVFDEGTLFEYNISTNILSKKVDFDGSILGEHPNGGLLLASNGMLYGNTQNGGTNNCGTLFEYNTLLDSLEIKLNLDNNLGPNQSGTASYGTLIEITPGEILGKGHHTLYSYFLQQDSVVLRYRFQDNYIEGKMPNSELLSLPNGKAYGTTSLGGLYGSGILYEYDFSSNTHKTLVDFNSSTGSGGVEVRYLSWDGNNKIYGTHEYGGNANQGTLYEYNLVTNSFQKLYDFDTAGYNPIGNLVIDTSTNKLYGVTSSASTSIGGVYKYDLTTNVLTHGFPFSNATGYDVHNMVLAPNGKIYMVAKEGGGSFIDGVLLEYDTATNWATPRVNFGNWTVTGENPISLSMGIDSNLYGGTEASFTNNGVIFKYDYQNNIYNEIVLTNSSIGQSAVKVLQAPNKKLYSITNDGGPYGEGALFVCDTLGNQQAVTYSFGIIPTGKRPITGLVDITCMPSYDSISITACDSIYSPSGNYVWSTSGVYQDIIYNSLGCDSLITANVTITNSNINSFTLTSCDSLNLNGQTYYNSGVDTQMFQNILGCDSMLVVNLTINNSANASVSTSGLLLNASPTGAAYQWIQCNPYAVIPGATNQTYTVSANGDYAVVVTQNGCSDTSNCITVSNVGMNEFEIKGISVYPNPTHNKFIISSDNSFQNASLQLLNALGQVVYKQEDISGVVLEVDISKFATGLYTLELRDGNQVSRVKVLKK